MWIFSFHMPLFVLVTGYFARKSLAGTTGRKMLLQIGLQYLIFQSLYSALDVSLFHVSNIQHSIFAPYLLLWFLASHACWRLLMLGMSRWSITAKFLFAVTAGVAVGYLQLDGVWFSISRTFVYLPFSLSAIISPSKPSSSSIRNISKSLQQPPPFYSLPSWPHGGRISLWLVIWQHDLYAA